MLKLKPTVKKSKVDDEIVLLDSASGVYYGLNEVGSRMLELALNAENEEEIIRKLLEEYEVDESRLRQDYRDLMDALQSKGLIGEV
ncbi:MAG: PqqD family protein [Rectinemataceae bacterium]|nr:PqqD family protein [Spirochaetaceae bacterium]